MSDISDQELMAWIERIEKGASVPGDLSSEDCARLETARRLFALRRSFADGIAPMAVQVPIAVSGRFATVRGWTISAQLAIRVLAVAVVLGLVRLVGPAGHSGVPDLPASGRILIRTGGQSPRLMSLNPQTRESTDLGSVAIAGSDPLPCCLVVASPDRRALLLLSPNVSAPYYQATFALRSTIAGALITLIGRPEPDRAPQSFVWSPEGNAILFTRALLGNPGGPPPTKAQPANSATPTIIGYELVRVGYSIEPSGNLVAEPSETVWRSPIDLATVSSLEAAAWDPVNHRVALVTRDDGPQLVLIDTDSGDTVLTIPFESRRVPEIPSPDGRWIAHADCGGPACGGAAGRVLVIELATGLIVELGRTSNPDHTPGNLTWAPDGSAIAWREGADVTVGRSTHMLRVADWPQEPKVPVRSVAESDDENLEIFGFSPDSLWLLAAEVDPTQPRRPSTSRDLIAVPLHGGAPRPLTAVSPDAQVVGWLE